MRKLKLGLIATSGLSAALGVHAPVAAQSAAMNYTKAYRYDSGGRVLGTISPPPVVGTSTNFLAARNSYDSQGRLYTAESGLLSSWQSDTVAPASWGAAFSVKKTITYSYDIYGNKSQETVTGSDGIVGAVAQYAYDGYDRPVCTAVRMDSTRWSTMSDPCVPQQTTASAGPDRVSMKVYDSLGREIQEWTGIGTGDATAVATRSWTVDSKLQYLIDGDGNKAQMVYDSYDRPQCWILPSKTAPTAYNPSTQSTALSSSGAVSGDCTATPPTGDYEQYGYDPNSNRTSLRKRDGSTITYHYDALNRNDYKIVPSRADLTSAQTRSVYYSYDLVGHELAARFDSTSGADGVTNSYDPFGELLTTAISMGSFSKTVGSSSDTYDSDGDRTLLTHPDGNAFRYGYDGLDRLTDLYEGAGTTTELDKFTWATDGTLGSRTEGASGPTATYTPDPIGQLRQQVDAFPVATAKNVTWNLTRNPASQIATETRSNSAYAWTGAVAINRPYALNGLNQYTSVGTLPAFLYDNNGNLIYDGNWTYTYDVENRMVKAVSGSTTVNLTYDPTGRLLQTDQGTTATTTKFVYLGDAMVLEYDGSGALANRYVHGANQGVDDPLVWYTGSGLTAKNWLHADHLGSVVAIASSGGGVTVNTYDEYGNPVYNSSNQSTNTGRFQYTGQAWVPELNLYYYKARFYSPSLGRFMQTDPIGYAGGINMYAYVGNDPVDHVDPTGLADVAADCIQRSICHETVAQTVSFSHQSHGKTVVDSTVSVISKFSKTTDAKGHVSWNVNTAVSNASGKAFSNAQLQTMATSVAHMQAAGINAGLGPQTTQILSAVGAAETNLGTAGGPGFWAGNINPMALRGGRENGDLDHNVRGAIRVWSGYARANGPDPTDIYEGYSDGSKATMAHWRATFNSLTETDSQQ